MRLRALKSWMFCQIRFSEVSDIDLHVKFTIHLNPCAQASECIAIVNFTPGIFRSHLVWFLVGYAFRQTASAFIDFGFNLQRLQTSLTLKRLE